MLSMVVVMISMSMASIRRISEVLNEKADLTDPEDPVRLYQMDRLILTM